MAQTDQLRYQVFLPKADGERLEELARQPGASKSRLLATAWSYWLKRRGTDELEERFGRRLDRMSGQLARIERNGQVDIESQALFIRYMLTVTAPLAEGDDAGQALGRDRFAAFVERVGRRLASGNATFTPDDEKED